MSTILMVVIAWTIALPLLVTVGLYSASTVLGRRARRSAALAVDGFEMDFSDAEVSPSFGVAARADAPEARDARELTTAGY